jgi:release factor glutamine methyltransferase
VARGAEFLERKGCAEARLEAELLVAHSLGLARLELFLALDRPVDEDERGRARDLLVRRGQGEPVAYLTGGREFYGRPFAVGPGVLVPRPETELLVDRAREVCAGREAPVVAELGTGSGCIAVTLALEVPGARVVASDVSTRALETAKANAERNGAEVRLVHGDGLGPLAAALEGGCDLLVSNPPYVDPASDELSPGVREHEPAEALFAPAGDTDHWVRRLVDEGLCLEGSGLEGSALLRPGGALLVELGADQAPRVLALCAERGLAARTHADLAGIERVLEVSRP